MKKTGRKSTNLVRTASGSSASGLSMLSGCNAEYKAKQLQAVIKVLKKEFGSDAKAIFMESVRVNI